jgi:hypothetical protein
LPTPGSGRQRGLPGEKLPALLQVGACLAVLKRAFTLFEDKPGVPPDALPPRGLGFHLVHKSQHVEQADQHEGGAGGVLANDAEHRVTDAVVVAHTLQQTNLLFAPDHAGRKVAPGHLAQRVAQSFQHARRRERVVRAG